MITEAFLTIKLILHEFNNLFSFFERNNTDWTLIVFSFSFCVGKYPEKLYLVILLTLLTEIFQKLNMIVINLSQIVIII